MKTLNGQNRLSSAQPSAVTVRKAVRRLSAKKHTETSVVWKDKSRIVLSMENPPGSIPNRHNIHIKHELKSSNDEITQDVKKSGAENYIAPSLTKLQDFVIKETQHHALSLDTSGFSPILLLAHPSSIVYITTCQQDHRMIYVSPQIANLGFSPETCLGKPDLRLHRVHEEDSETVLLAFKNSCATAEIFSCHYRLYDSNGKVRWFHDEASVVCDEAGVPMFIRGVMLDITDKKELEAELAKHRYYLELNVEQRTAQLVKRMSVLESCNAALCDKLALTRKHLAALNQRLQHALPESVLADIDLPKAA